MKTMLYAIALAGVTTLVGCASTSTSTQVAKGYDAQANKECKFAPIMTENVVNPNRRQPTELERRSAETQLAGTPYYQRSYGARGSENTLADAKRDCY